MKFARQDAEYVAHRKKLSERYGSRELWSVIDHWPLYCGIANLGRFLTLADLLRRTLSVPGHVAEFGSWRGASTLLFAKLLELYDPHGPKQVHAFDSFEGLARFSEEDGSAGQRHGDYKGSLEEIEEMLSLYGLSDTVVIHQGDIEQTLPALMQARRELTFSLIFADTDLFTSTQVILEQLHERLAVGGLFIFDEWNHEAFPGEGVAVNEFLKRQGQHYRMLSVVGARQPTLVLEKIPAP